MKKIVEIASKAASATEIIIKPLQIANTAKSLKALATSVQNRSLKIDFTYSKGDAVDELEQYAENLKQTGDAIALLMQKTAELLDEASLQFLATDQSISEKILKGN